MFEFQLKCVPKGLVDNTLAVAQVMAWCWTGDKASAEPMMTQFMWHQASVGKVLSLIS